MREKLFNEILNTIENEDIKNFGEKCIQKIYPYFWEIPASSSLKYHAAYACTIPLGLAKHTLAVVMFLNYMFQIESIHDQFTSRERDLLRIAGMMHDTMKSGTQEDYEKSKWTKFDHPLLAAKMVYNMDGLTQEERKFIAMAISSHMGQWNTDKRSDIILPTPKDKYQIILHLADYLASRKDIEIKFDNLPEAEAQPLPDINTWVVKFGKYKDEGLTIPQLAEKYPGYFRWAQKNVTIEPAKTLLQSYEG